MRSLSVLIPFTLLAACAQQGASEGIQPTHSHSFEPIMVERGEEVADVCQSWTLDNDEPLFVSKIRQTNGGAWHHSNWFFVPETTYPGPDGTWDCDDRGFHDVTAGLEGGAFFAQSTQTLQELQAFQQGAVLEIPPRHKIVGGVHLVNISAGALETALRFDIETVHEDQVEVRLRPIAFTNTALDIEPQAESRYGMTCDLGPQFQSVLGEPPDYSIYYVLAHYHEWGNYFRLSFVDDSGAERTIFELENSIGEPLGITLDPPIPSLGAGRLRVECGYLNDTDRRLTYGLAGKEMCVFLAYSDADLKIGASSAENTAMGPNEDGVFMNETACGPLLAVRAD
ncbi:MAG: hypothetical protein KJO57_13445 [Deltaproteobacteria bacterium]|nr:hypothetical protein [Deltaproteobacteria bacterium]